ncbi:MAG: MBL fold metallo-hydrolase [Gammaproteobacteria bacterium]
MQIIRGDDYQSWVYAHHDDLVVVDPWLTNKQVFPGLNWLLHRSALQESYLVKNNLINKVTHIIITAHFSDHLDLDSLNQFDKDIHIFTTHEASKVLIKNGFNNVTIVKINQSYELGSLRLRIYQAGKPYHSTTFAYSLEDENAKVFHESHMFNKNLVIEDIDACIMTIDKVKVFGIVQVSMDIEQAKSAQLALNAKYFIPTGIAPSRTKGLISYILSIKEFDSGNDLLPAVCRQVGDTLSI